MVLSDLIPPSNEYGNKNLKTEALSWPLSGNPEG